MSKIWFSSDLHLGHTNIIKYCGRPFVDAKSMTETIISNHNKVVGQNDLWFHLGDFAMAGSGKAGYLLSRLNGRKFMIAGNHDKRVLFSRDNNFNIIIKDAIKPHVEWVKDYYEMWVNDPKYGKKFIVLHHYAQRIWNASHKGSIALFGHSHNGLPDDPNALSMDVGIDSAAAKLDSILKPENYRPFSLEEVLNFMDAK